MTVSASGMAATLYLLAESPFIVAGSVSLVVYVGLLWVTQAISSDEATSLFAKRDDEQVEAPMIS